MAGVGYKQTKIPNKLIKKTRTQHAVKSCFQGTRGRREPACRVITRHLCFLLLSLLLTAVNPLRLEESILSPWLRLLSAPPPARLTPSSPLCR